MNGSGQQTRLAGPFQQLVMLAVIRLGPKCHGGAVHRHIEQRTGRWISLKAVYTTLQRLERRGYVCSWLRPPLRSRWMPDWKRPGPTLCRAARRFYSIQALGRRALRLSLLASDRMQSGLPGFGRENELYSCLEPTRSPRPFRFRNRRLQEQYGTWPASDPRWIELEKKVAAAFADEKDCPWGEESSPPGGPLAASTGGDRRR